MIQHATINNLGFGRSVDETLRVLQAIQYIQSHPDEVRNGDRGAAPAPRDCGMTAAQLWRSCHWRSAALPPSRGTGSVQSPRSFPSCEPLRAAALARLRCAPNPSPPPTSLQPQVCPAGWKPGDATMNPDPVKSKAFFAKVA